MWACQVVLQRTLHFFQLTDSSCFVPAATLQISIRNQLLVANDWCAFVCRWFLLSG
jgi:hypothetical protein